MKLLKEDPGWRLAVAWLTVGVGVVIAAADHGLDVAGFGVDNAHADLRVVCGRVLVDVFDGGGLGGLLIAGDGGVVW
ncbi:MAG: hypothetical protein ACLTKG_00855 [Collinsella intestinalis]